MWDIAEDGSIQIQTSLPENPTVVQLRSHTDKISKEGKTLAIIQVALHYDIFIKIVTLKTSKEV